MAIAVEQLRRTSSLPFARRLPPWALAGGACAALVALAVASTPFAPRADASPIVPDGHWRTLYVLGVAGAFGAYVVGVTALRRASVPTVRTAAVVVIAAAVQLAPLAAPPLLLLSKDAYAYWAYARVGAVHGENPYAVPPARFPDDPATRRAGVDWLESTSLYGPAFTGVSEGVAAAAGNSPRAAMLGFRALGAASVLALVLLAALVARNAAFGAAFVGWNPLLALHFAGGGHNDALMMVGVLAALALAARGRGRLAGAAWVLGVAVKWIPLVLVPLWALAARPPLRRAAVVGALAAAAVVAALASARYGTAWLGVAGAGSGDRYWASSISLPHHLQRLGLPIQYAVALLALCFLGAYLWLLREAWRGRARLALAAGLLALSAGWLVPWYAVWAVPLAAVENDAAGRRLALGLTGYLLLDAVPR